MIPEKHNGPGANRTVAGKSFDGDNAILAPAADTPRPRLSPQDLPSDYLERFTLRLLQDALGQATRTYWHRRADELDACRSRPGDWPGAQLDSWAETMARAERAQQRDDRLAADALECRRHADLFRHDVADVDLIREVLGLPLEAVA